LFALREYAARRGFSIYKEYVDRVSGDLERRRAELRERACNAILILLHQI
jgi:hypothetical protein